MNTRTKTIIGLSLLLATFFAGKYSTKPKIEFKDVEKIVYVEKEIKNEVKKERKHIRTTKKPDGTIEELDTSTLDTFLASQKDAIIDFEKKTESTTTYNETNMILGAFYTNERNIGLSASFKVFGPIWIIGSSELGLKTFSIGAGVGL